MSEQLSPDVRSSPAQANHSNQRLVQAATWLRDRLLPRENSIMIAAYIVILVSLIGFILDRAQLAPWRFYGVILAFSALFVLHVVLPDSEARFGEQHSSLLHLLLGGLLFFVISGLGDITWFTFFPAFVLISQSFFWLPFRSALFYTLVLLAVWLTMIVGKGAPLDTLINLVTSIGLSVVFTIVFTLTMLAYARQTDRAEELLAQLQAANAELEAARDHEKNLAVAEERLHLARDIHDGLGHHLTVLNVQLQAAAKMVQRDPERAKAIIELCRGEAQAALDEVRQSVATMRRTPLEGRSLNEALDALVSDFKQHGLMDVYFAQEGETVTLAPAVAMTLYRAVQEGLTNAQKHSVARQVAITLTFTTDLVRLTIYNNGVMTKKMPGNTSSGGFGLAGLRERAEQLGGLFTATAVPGGGFMLKIELPHNG